LNGFVTREIVQRIEEHDRSGLILRTADPQRLEELLDHLSSEFARRSAAVPA
jgi:hypothetical protein